MSHSKKNLTGNKLIKLKQSNTKKSTSQVDKLKEQLAAAESENIKLQQQLDIKNDLTHFDNLMLEFKERALFVSEFSGIVSKMEDYNDVLMSAKYIDNMFNLPFLYTKSIKELFSGTIDYVIKNINLKESYESCYMKMLMLTLPEKSVDNIKTKCGNYKLTEIYKIGDWEDTEMNGIAMIFTNDDKSVLPLYVRIINKKFNDYQIVHNITEEFIKAEGKKIENVYAVNLEEYEIGFGESYSDDEINNIKRNSHDRKDILNEFIIDLAKYIEPLSKGHKLVCETQLVPELEIVKSLDGSADNSELQCSITHMDPPFINVIIKCNCYSGKGRKLSLMALAGIVSNMNSVNKDVCPFCKERLIFGFKESKPTKTKPLDIARVSNKNLPEIFKQSGTDMTNVMSKDALDFVDKHKNRFLNDEDEDENDNNDGNNASETEDYQSEVSEDEEEEELEESEICRDESCSCNHG